MRYTQAAAPSDVTYIDACAAPGATTVLMGADDGSYLARVPFAFRYWATDLAANFSVGVTSNGYVSMMGAADAWTTGTIPDPDDDNGVIAAHWRDLVNNGNQCIATVGAAPSRKWVVSWPNSRNYAGAGTLNFEIILSEGSNTIDVVYQTMTGALAGTSGVENQTGTMGVAGCPGGTLYTCTPTAGTRIRYTPSP